MSSMREVTETASERDISQNALERLHLMHRRFVGPTTAAQTLPFVFESLTRSQAPSHLYAAGWVAIEAGITASSSPEDERLLRIRQASDALELAQNNALEWAFQKAEEHEHYPEYSFGLRISATMAFIPLFESLARGRQPNGRVVKQCYDSLLRVALQTSETLIQTQHEDPSRTSGYIGLLNELHTMLTINRYRSTKSIAIPSLERSDDGSLYRKQTHDVQVLNIERGKIKNTTPFESKMRLKPGHRDRYDAALVGGNIHFQTDNIPGLTRLTQLFQREANGKASPKEIKRLDRLSGEFFHLSRHYHRPELLGRHCLGAANCRVAS